jgi:hypothetical protein
VLTDKDAEAVAAAVRHEHEQREPHCAACRFLVGGNAKLEASGYGDGRGSCRRYPTPLAKSPRDWCGEFAPRRS